MAETGVELAAARGWPDEKVLSVRTRLGTMSSETVVAGAVAVGSPASASGSVHLWGRRSGRSSAVGCPHFQPETGSDFEEV